MHVYTLGEIQKIVNAAFQQGFEAGRVLQREAAMPDPPPALSIVDHPFTASDAPAQYKRPWLNDPRGQRGLTGAVETPPGS